MKVGIVNKIVIGTIIFSLFFACKKNSVGPTNQNTASLTLISASVNGISNGSLTFSNVDSSSVSIACRFSAPLDSASVNSNSIFLSGGGQANPCVYSYSNNDSTLIIRSVSSLKALTAYDLVINQGIKSKGDSVLKKGVGVNIYTSIDSSDKFPQITDSALLTLIEQQTFNYFWNGGNSVSGLARERTSSGNTVTTGGSGFGIMSMLVGVQRNFITRSQALSRIDTIVDFLTNKATRYHGAFPHWIDGSSGATIPFSSQDDGGDIVETSYMMQGLLCARQFFNSTTSADEINLRSMINDLYDSVQWNWYRQNGQNVLYWNWSPDQGFVINVQVGGWCEALITYVLAASSNVDSNTIPKVVYDNGWAHNGGMKNGNSYYGIQLPLGPSYGGPLFFAHYSFLGINPNNLTDAYANYWTQDTAHARINYLYCVNNPKNYYGYSSSCWGLTASDIQNGYDASSPTEDNGVIAPTAAISSLPYSPTESMNAIRFFYYKLGDKIWNQYGFIDAFNLTNIWFDSDCLAIDQGPQIVMIENYRSGLLWSLFMSCPEVKRGMTNLGFTSPNL